MSIRDWYALAWHPKATRARQRQRTLPGVETRRSDALRPEQQSEAAAAMLDLLAGRITSAEYARRLAAL